MLDLAVHPHRRFNPLTGEWILVSPHRSGRPWQGRVERLPSEGLPRHDPSCYLCPGNARAGGARNPAYTGTFVFTNDYSALLPDTPPAEEDTGGLLRAAGEPGICRVVCFSPRHDLTLADLDRPEILRLLECWTEEYTSLGAEPWIRHVQIFENKGELMGCSNPHPHGQIWAQRTVPVEPAKEAGRQAAYRSGQGTCLLCDYLGLELRDGRRVVCANDGFVALVPFWAVWPFETMVLPRRHLASLPALAPEEREGLADMLKRVAARYDNLFGVPFPYSSGLHQAPTDGAPHPEWHLHMHFLPPLLRSAAVKKFMVGYEMLANPQRDLTAEASAERLRGTDETPLHPREEPARP